MDALDETDDMFGSAQADIGEMMGLEEWNDAESTYPFTSIQSMVYMPW
jgi:hypothetical protein